MKLYSKNFSGFGELMLMYTQEANLLSKDQSIITQIHNGNPFNTDVYLFSFIYFRHRNL